MVEATRDPALPWVNATLECYAGAMNRVDPSTTAFPPPAARYQPVTIGAWDDPADDATGRAWARGLAARVAPWSLAGGFLNFLTLDEEDRAVRVAAGYGQNHARLLRLKHRYD